jgi:hypothetical protein
MGITRLRASSQVAPDSITTQLIRDNNILAEDLSLSPGSIDASALKDGSLKAKKLHPDIAGEGLVLNPTTNAIDINIDVSMFDLVLDQLKVDAVVTLAGNVFNTANSLVKLDSFGKLPALDGSQLTGLFGSSNFVDLLEPSGSINGINKDFVLPQTPVTGSLHLYFNGILQKSGIGNDYSISGSTISMTDAPTAGSTLLCSYRV